MIDTRLISRADQLAALARMTETEKAATEDAIHQSYTPELKVNEMETNPCICGRCNYQGRHRRSVMMPAGTVRYHNGHWHRGTEDTSIDGGSFCGESEVSA